MLEGRLVKQRGHFSVDVRLSCGCGELLALTGPSGSGKTTVIRMLAGLETPDSGLLSSNGRVWFDSGKNIDIPVRKRRVGYVFQEHTLFPHLSIEGNVRFSCRDKGRVRELLDDMGILHLAGRKPHEVSGGERQRAAIAQALASDPSVLLLDEPFSALDSRTRLRLRHLLKELKPRLHIPIVMVTHDEEEARFLANEIISIPNPHPPSHEVAEGKEFASGLSFSPV